MAELCRGMLAEALGVNVSLKTAWLEVCKSSFGWCYGREGHVRQGDAGCWFWHAEVPRFYSGKYSATAEEAEHYDAVDCYGQQLRRCWHQADGYLAPSGRSYRKANGRSSTRRSFTKQNQKKRKPGDEVSVLPGEPLEARHGGLLEHARHLGESPGWHMVDTVGVHVAHGAKSFRSPQPRFSLASFPLRTTLGEFNTGSLTYVACVGREPNLEGLVKHDSGSGFPRSQAR